MEDRDDDKLLTISREVGRGADMHMRSDENRDTEKGTLNGRHIK